MLMNSVLTVGSNVPLAVSYPFGMSKERLIVKRRYCYPQMPKSCSRGCPRSCPIKTKKRGVVPELSPVKTIWLGQVEPEQDKKKNPGNRSAFVDKAVNQIITAAESAMGEKLSCKATD